MAIDQIGRHGAGQLACGGAPHAISHHEERPASADLVVSDFRLQAGISGAQVGNEECVLVVIAGAAQVGLAEDGDGTTRWSRAEEKGPFRRVGGSGLTNLGSAGGSVNAVLA